MLRALKAWLCAPRADEDEEDDDEWADEEEEVDVLEGAVGSSGGVEGLSEQLLEFASAAFKLRVLMADLDEAEFRAISPRLRLFLEEVAKVPTRPGPQKPGMGFKVG